MLTRTFILRSLGAIALLLCAVAFAACGGGGDDGLSKGDYKNKSQQISDKLETDLQTAQQNLQGGGQEALTGLNQFKSSITDARTKLDALDPPKDFEDVHTKLVNSLKQVEGTTQQLLDAAAAKDQAKAQTAAQQFQTDLQALQSAGNEFDKKVGTT
jgi:hypothetical protein